MDVVSFSYPKKWIKPSWLHDTTQSYGHIPLISKNSVHTEHKTSAFSDSSPIVLYTGKEFSRSKALILDL